MVLQSSILFSRSMVGLKTLTRESVNPMKGLLPGSTPIIRTKPYLKHGIVFRDSIRIMMINYADFTHNHNHLHEGAR